MTETRKAFTGADIFDGHQRRRGHVLIIDAEKVVAIEPEESLDPGMPVERFSGGVIFPGFVDLQVNGGGGIMFNEDQSVQTLRVMAEAHASVGATTILPTLITDTPDKTAAAIEAAKGAIAARVPGIAGLHLEGPHLSLRRTGAHDPAFIRPMTEEDLLRLEAAARDLPVLMVTVATENVTPDQIRRMSDAGILVSLGHCDAPFDDCLTATRAGAVCVTHLFNAMSQLGSREPGLVGAALTEGGLSAGLIADGIHVHPKSIGIALSAKQGPGQVFLVSDAMAVAGTAETAFDLGGRTILRQNGRLTLADGTLAGADLDLLTAIRNLLRWSATSEDHALAMATSIPADVAGLGQKAGCLVPGSSATFQHADLGSGGAARIWVKGQEAT